MTSAEEVVAATVVDAEFRDGLGLLACHFLEDDAEGLLVDTRADVPVGAPVTLRVNLAEQQRVTLPCIVRWRRSRNGTSQDLRLALECAAPGRPALRRLLTAARDLAGAALNRAHVRVATRMSAEVHDVDGGTMPGEVLDISEDGVLIRVPVVPPAGSVVRLTLHPASPSSCLSVPAMVVWRSDGEQGTTGMMFLSDDDEQRKLLRHVVAVILMRRGAGR